MAEIAAILAGAISTSITLQIAALGEMLLERTGRVNLGLEGMIALSASVAVLAGSKLGSPMLGLLFAVIAGAAFSLAFTFLVEILKADQIVVGLSLVFAGIGAADIVGKAAGGLPSPPIIDNRPFLAASILLALSLWVILDRSWLGIEIKSIGDDERKAVERGLNVRRIRALASLFCGTMAGVAGAFIVLSIFIGRWFSGVTSGWGWLSIGVVILGYWNPIGILVSSYLIGILFYLRPILPALGLPAQMADMMPYLAIIALLAVSSKGFGKRVRPPASIWRESV